MKLLLTNIPNVKSCLILQYLTNLIDLFDNRYAVLTASLKHCEEKLDKLGENDSKRHKNYLQVISSLIKEGGQGKIGGLSEKFQNLQEMVTYISEKFEDKQEYLPSIDSKHSTNIVIFL